MIFLLCLLTIKALYLGDANEIQLTYLIDSEFIEFNLQCKTLFWCSIGFSDSYSNADIIRLLYQNNQLSVQDLLSKQSYKFIDPLIDTSQDIDFISGSTTATTIQATFKRKLITDDPTDYPIQLYQNVPMFYMLGQDYNFTNYKLYSRFTLDLMNSTLYSCHYTCSVCSGPFGYQCLRCADSREQTLNGTCTSQNDVSFPPAGQNIVDTDFQVFWTYSIKNKITLLFSVVKCDWFGLGFNSTTMDSTDMVVIRLEKVTTNDLTTYFVTVHDMQGIKSKVPDEDIYLGGSQDWRILGVLVRDQVIVKIQRDLKTNDVFDYDFTQKKDIQGLYSFGNNLDGQFLYHGANRGAFQLNLSVDDTTQKLTQWQSLILKGHTFMLFFFWAVLADIGVFFGRQMKSYPKYSKVHGTIFLFQGIFTYFFVFTMISQEIEAIQELGFQSSGIIIHFFLGIGTLILTTGQLYFGLIVRNNLESINGTEKIYRIKQVHHFLGYILYIVTKIQVAIGVHIYDPDLETKFYAYYVLLILLKVAIEMLYSFQVSLINRKRIKYGYVEVDQNHLYESIVEKLNTGTPHIEMLEDYPKLNYVILREAIYDVSDFNHPGGQYIFRQIRGKEIGRYFYGGYPIQQIRMNPHAHSAFAINYIETRYIGDFKNESCPILYHEENILFRDDQKHIWTLSDIKKMSNQASLFVFQSPYFKCRQHIKGVNWFGRYFYIKPFAAGINILERPYTVVQCLSEHNIEMRAQIIEYFKSCISGNQKGIQQLNIQKELIPTIQFVIKNYQGNNNLSRFIHVTAHKRYEITGPYGFGLELDQNSNGVHYIFCNGTGVLPFLDLIDYLLKKALYHVLSQNCGKSVADKLQFQDEDYEQTLDKFQLILVGSFQSINQFYGFPLVSDLFHVCQKYNYPIFDMHIRFSKTIGKFEDYEVRVREKFDDKFIKNILKYQMKKVYVCGSPQFEEDVMKSLEHAGVDRKFILQI